MQFYPYIITFPEMLMRDRSVMWELASRTISGGQVISGAMPIGRMDGGGLWTCTLDGVQVSTADQVRAWRALAGLLDGGVTPVVVTARDVRLAPWASSETALLEATHSDGSVLGDGSDYVSARISAETTVAASLRAVSLTISLSNANPLRGGEHFSILHPNYSHRLYRVVSAVVNDAGDTVCTIRPPLREAVDAGMALDFDYPRCIMRLASPDAMDLALDMRFYGASRNVRFVEAMPPYEGF